MEYIKKRGKLEHRRVVEEFIGRKLTKEEVVHHLDFNKQNNSINNLMLFANQKDHASFHIKFEKFGLNKQIRNQISFRWKEYKQIQVSIKDISQYTGFSKPVWFEGLREDASTKN